MTERIDVLKIGYACDTKLTNIISNLRGYLKRSSLSIFNHQFQQKSRRNVATIETENLLKEAQIELREVVEAAKNATQYHDMYQNVGFVMRMLEIISERLDKVVIDRNINTAITQVANVQNGLRSYLHDVADFEDREDD